MPRLEGKVAVITGAGTGIGRATAKLFAQEGARVVVAELNAEAGEQTAQLIVQAGGEAIAITTDVTEPDSIQAAIDKAVQHYGDSDSLGGDFKIRIAAKVSAGAEQGTLNRSHNGDESKENVAGGKKRGQRIGGPAGASRGRAWIEEPLFDIRNSYVQRSAKCSSRMRF